MISKRDMPTDGAFLAIWPRDHPKYMNACQMEWRQGVLHGFNDFTEYWERATEQNGWFGLDEAYYLLKEDFR